MKISHSILFLTTPIFFLTACGGGDESDPYVNFAVDYVCETKGLQEANQERSVNEASEATAELPDIIDRIARDQGFENAEDAFIQGRNYIEGSGDDTDEARKERADFLEDTIRANAKGQCEASDQLLNDLNF